MALDPNRVSFRLRNEEAGRLAGLVEELHKNLPEFDDPQSIEAQFWKNIGKFQLTHLMVGYCHARRRTLIPLFCKMAKEKLRNFDEFEYTFGPVPEFESSQEILSESYIEKAPERLTKGDRERLLKKHRSLGVGRPKLRRAEL